MNTSTLWGYFKNQEFQKIIKEGESLTKYIEEFNPELVRLLGLAYDQQALLIKDKKERSKAQKNAKKYFKLLIKYNENSEDGYRGLGLVLLHQNRLKESMKFYKEAININPKNYSTYLSIGNVYRAEKKYKNACEWYKKSMKDENNELTALINISLMYKDARNMSFAKRYGRLALDIINDKKNEKWTTYFKKELKKFL